MDEVIVLSSDDSDVEVVGWDSGPGRPPVSNGDPLNGAPAVGITLHIKPLKIRIHDVTRSVTITAGEEIENLAPNDCQLKTEIIKIIKESPVTEPGKVTGSVNSTKVCPQPSPANNSESQTGSNALRIEPILNESLSMNGGIHLSELRQDENFNESKNAQQQNEGSHQLQSLIDSPSTPTYLSPEEFNSVDGNLSSSIPKTSTSPERNTHSSKMEQLEWENPESKHCFPSCESSADCLNTTLKSECLPQQSLTYACLKSEYEQTTSTRSTKDNTPDWQMDCETYSIESVSPISFLEPDHNTHIDMNGESRFNMDFSTVDQGNKKYVSPEAYKKIATGASHFLVDDSDVSVGAPEELCRESLSLVYITIEENYTEGTLQLLSDLIQPWSYLPKDITSHLLYGILLNPQCPRDLSVMAFNLLMKAQRHHMADKYTIVWDWELLTSVMDDQTVHTTSAKPASVSVSTVQPPPTASTISYHCQVVRMLLEYVVQTIEDDFRAKHCTSALHQSIAKATLSCDQRFSRVRDVIRWLLCAITKTTEPQSSKQITKERDEQLRKVSLLQRMLSMALEVDRSPALSCAKLSEELCQRLASKTYLRAHRMLLLETVQSKLLRCKMLEILLKYASPPIFVPMSLSLLLHYLKNCMLQQDPTDGTEKWQKWEELIQLIWMLLHSYDHAMKTCLSSSLTQPQSSRPRTLFYKPHDKISKPAVNEAVEAFLSRSQADLGESLPLHVEELLTYLQDHLLDVCQ
ncbi:uncharacterized protein simc1 [Gouania willdenowi]|uniref:SUMO-interacting motif-containing protein 1 n=1 Tax=Gouania willdenowi TaxID=441366 RepID=A0A8C5DND5_GOUWI|nr:SUMO-interacting motif-containing protein 1 [Gouania willdenowi]